MPGEKRKDAAEVGIGARRGGTGGTHMARRGHIEGIVRGIDLIADPGIDHERNIRIEGSGQGATREEETTIAHHAGGGSEVIRQVHQDERGIREMEAMSTEDDDRCLRRFTHSSPSTSR